MLWCLDGFVEQELGGLHGPELGEVPVADAEVARQVARHPHVIYPEEGLAVMF